MKEQQRNIIVGLTVLVGLVLLATLVVLFTGLPQWFQDGTRVEIRLSQSYEIKSGDPIYLLGKRVGLVDKVGFVDGDPLEGILILATIDADVPLPRNVRARVASRGLVGKKFLVLNPEGPLPKDPATGDVQRFYHEGVIRLEASEAEAQGLLPKEVTDAMQDFGALARKLNELIGPTSQPTTAPASGPADAIPPGLAGTVARMNRTLDALHAIVGDEANQKNLSAGLKHFSEASAGVDELSRQMLTHAETVSKILAEIQTASAAMNTTEGTVGKMLNDPRLYNDMVRVTEQMQLLLKDLRTLAETWQAEGMGVKLK